jgi:inactivated superfamily I helicase
VAGELTAGPICLALADALGAPREPRSEAGLAVALLELAATALRSLEAGANDNNPVVVANGLPLALNAADALYSLAHLSLLDLAFGAEGLESRILTTFDRLCAGAWEAQAAGEGELRGQSELGRAAGELAALAAGRAGQAQAMGDLGAAILVGGTSHARSLIEALPVGAQEKEKLTAIVA